MLGVRDEYDSNVDESSSRGNDADGPFSTQPAGTRSFCPRGGVVPPQRLILRVAFVVSPSPRPKISASWPLRFIRQSPARTKTQYSKKKLCRIQGQEASSRGVCPPSGHLRRHRSSTYYLSNIFSSLFLASSLLGAKRCSRLIIIRGSPSCIKICSYNYTRKQVSK